MPIRRGKDQSRLDKRELVDQLVVVEETDFDYVKTDYNDKAPQWDGTVIVCSGPMTGQKHEDVRYFGNLAEQLHRHTKDGDQVVLRFKSGESKKAGAANWFGVSHTEVSDAEFDKCVEIAERHAKARTLPKAGKAAAGF